MKSFKNFTEIEEAEYKGRKVDLNNPTRASDGKKKFYVYVKNEKGNVIKLGFGDPNMEIKRDDPARRNHFVQDITVMIQDPNGKQDIGVVTNGEPMQR